MIPEKNEKNYIQWETVVQQRCLSTCALMWLAGRERWVYPDARIGFQAISYKSGEPSTGSNAVVGAYLANLGLSEVAIRYLTSAPPNSMAPLDKAKADELGIATRTVRN
jgi:hypothetical protein